MSSKQVVQHVILHSFNLAILRERLFQIAVPPAALQFAGLLSATLRAWELALPFFLKQAHTEQYMLLILQRYMKLALVSWLLQLIKHRRMDFRGKKRSMLEITLNSY